MEPSDETRCYAIGDLASLAGVTRRTIRYYAQQGLLPAPFGRGRGKNYGDAHLARLVQIKALQEHGLSLDEVRQRLGEGDVLELQRFTSSFEQLTGLVGSSNAVVLEGDAFTEADETVRLECPPFTGYSDAPCAESEPPSPSRTRWTRVVLAPGIELHVSSDHRLPPPGRLQELARWCVREFKLLARRSPK